MAQRGAPAGWDSPSDRPSVLQITVESDSRPRVTMRRPHVLVAIVVLAAIGAAILVAVLPGGGASSTRPPTPAPPTPAPPPSVLVDHGSLVQSGPPSATAPRLYRFPLGCWDSTPSGIHPRRTSSCWRGRLYVTAEVRQVGGVVKVTLEPTHQSCSQMPVPPLARGKVRACPR
jgi:hypothetical protein